MLDPFTLLEGAQWCARTVDEQFRTYASKRNPRAAKKVRSGERYCLSPFGNSPTPGMHVQLFTIADVDISAGIIWINHPDKGPRYVVASDFLKHFEKYKNKG